jgi:hypothetical protein
MPAFTLYGSIGSSNTDRVRMTLAEGGFTDYEFVTVDLRKGEQKVSSIHFNSVKFNAIRIMFAQRPTTNFFSNFPKPPSSQTPYIPGPPPQPNHLPNL